MRGKIRPPRALVRRSRDGSIAPDPGRFRDGGRRLPGAPRRRPKHVEVLARRGDGAWTELHVDVAGTINREKAPDADKCGAALA
ncbi:hypothetical protein CS379_32330 [Methylobacterium frigidaeris]|nr:hypothetical protein CS379_32330 [Methylobacterium frigidaeris]